MYLITLFKSNLKIIYIYISMLKIMLKESEI